tara:strand:- start:1192 stop:1416 length:225 start_codon:yes stop_codon:yes gene_type:complete
MTAKNSSKSIKLQKGGDVFSYSDTNCENNPETNPSNFGALFCDLDNVFTGVGKIFSNMFGGIDNTIELGEIMID